MARPSLFVLCLGALALSGCGPEGPKIPELSEASGIVTYQEKPVEGAEVVFSSSAADAKPARGTTGADGKFTLKTYLDPQHDLSGAIPGDYQVTVTKKELAKMSADDMAKMGGAPMAPSKDLIPGKYSDAKQSGLTATVKAKEKNSFSFPLAD
jgi:hypothetical protein